MTRGTDAIAAERERQIVEEGYTVEGDRNQGDLLARAGVEYANVAVSVLRSGPGAAQFDPPLRWNWPWSNEFWKPTGDPVRDLIKAGALIAAAIDSLTEYDVCTCPSGDGSLRWPCPQHPPTNQTNGDRDV